MTRSAKVNVISAPAAGADAPTSGRLLEVTDLKTHYLTDRGIVRAVDGVDLTLERGRTLGVVGSGGGLDGIRVHLTKEPGCGELQDRRNTQQCQHRNIAFAPFDLADIRVPYAYTGGEGAMGESPLLSVLAERRPQPLQRGILRG